MAVVETPTVTIEQDVVFGRGGSRDLLCDIYRPSPDRTKQTAVIHLHGGGFRGGSKAGARVARPLAERGYTSIAATYRLADEAIWPAQLHDVKTCIRWVRDNAQMLGVQPDKLVVLGHSAGGHLALIASGTQDDPAVSGSSEASTSTAIAACVAFYPPAELRANPVLGDNPGPDLLRSAAPIEYVKPGFPPTLLFHGTADLTISVDASLRLNNALRGAGAAVELHVVEGVTHIFDSHPDLAEASAVWIDLFLDRHVVNPRPYPSTEPRR